MNKKLMVLVCIALLCCLIFSACQNSTPIPEENAVSEVDERVSFQELEVGKGYIRPESSIEKITGTPKAISFSSGVSTLTPLQSGSDSAIEKINIIVKPVSMVNKHEAFTITNSKAQKQIIGYLEQMMPCSRPAPHTGGYIFEISISRNDIVEKFSLQSATDDKGNSYVTKDNQWYIANHALWGIVASYYPKFDYENNQPKYSISIMSMPKNSGAGLSFFDKPSQVWSETEQEKAVKILAYLDALQPVNKNVVGAENEKNVVRVYVYEGSISKEYLCYNLYGQNGKCIVRYEGEHVIEKGMIESPYTNGGWFEADAGFYKYLDSLL